MLPLIKISKAVRSSYDWESVFYMECMSSRHNVLRSLINKYQVNNLKTLNKMLNTKKGKYLKKGKLEEFSIQEYDKFISTMILIGLDNG